MNTDRVAYALLFLAGVMLAVALVGLGVYN
jgi:hypothetical protein